ncbi:MAG TPA: VOC family protein [Bacillales bacterium]|nr:VOC family protein [Bacillales bacterium]
MGHTFTGIDHVQLAAPKGCEKEARRFFDDILGMEEMPKPSNLAKRGGVWFKCGIHQLHIGVQEDFHPAKKAHPAFHVENLDQLREKLTVNGINVIEDNMMEGADRFYVTDPFGNRLELIHRNK